MSRELAPELIEQWLNGLHEFDEANTLIMLAVWTTLGIKANHLDVGSGTGAMVKASRGIKVSALGIDLLPSTEPYLLSHDLGKPIDLGYYFDVVTSIETAEHIEPESADTYLDNIARHVAPGGIVVFTAAMPGQPGHGHVNCQPAEYWRSRMYGRGLVYNAELTYRLALAWSIANTSLHHLEANLQVFKNA